MKLNDFLRMSVFSQYTSNIETIEKDFINSGYEKFLFREWNSEFEMRKKTEQIVNKSLFNLKMSPYIERFISQFDGLENSTWFIFPESFVPNYFMINDVVRHANGKKYVINNIFEEDDTTNLIAIIDDTKVEEITLIHHLVYSAILGENFGGYKLFGLDIDYYREFCAKGDFIYSLDAIAHEDIFHFQGFVTRKDTNPFRIYDTRKRIEMLVSLGYFQDEFEIYTNMILYLMPFLQSIYAKSKSIADNTNYDWKTQKATLKSKLIEEGTIISKWKNEQSLFKLVRKYYSDAVFQYRPKWLSPQSLDIFIPSINTAIEYQGIQHYESVDYFGGMGSFIKRKKLDEQKKKKCMLNGVNLIEWHYLMDISATNLKRQLSSIL